jgi:hypothetical protein
MTSATVSVWKDCGYTEGAYIVPSQSDNLPAPDFTFTLPSIPRDTLFSSFNVKHPYSDLYDCSYLRIAYDFNNGSDITLYGWIDNVGCMSDTSDSPNTTVSWHVDLWRTYLDKASFGAGTVTRRLPNNDDPPQSYPFKTSLVQDIKTELIPTNIYSDFYWAIINLTTGTGTKTSTTLCWPVNIKNPTQSYNVSGSGTTGQAPSYFQTMTGAFDELLGLDPTAIYGAWLSPISPADFTFSSNAFTMNPWTVYNGNKGYYAFRTYASGTESNYYTERSVSVNAKTRDTSQVVVTDYDANPILTLPWGVQVFRSYYRLINADVSVYISFRFTTRDSELIDASANGLSCSIPLKTLPLTENAKSSYIYSGQQEYDREQMQIARQQSFVSALTGGGQSAANTAIMSAIGSGRSETGSYSGPYKSAEEAKGRIMQGSTTEMIPSLSKGQAFGLMYAATATGAAIDYTVAGYFNDRTMDNTLSYMAQKTAAMTLPSSGTDWLIYGRTPSLVTLVWDQYSIEQRENDLLMYGARVHETHESCQDIIDAGGPLQINNLNVTGAIPVQAKNYFRRRFSDGVKIV